MTRLLIALTLFLAACSDRGSVPSTVLPPKEMGAVLYDVVRADEMVDFFSVMDSTYRTLNKRTNLYDTIFQLHAINKETFKKSLEFYEGRPDLLKSIFDSLQKRVDTMNKVDTAHKITKPV